MNQSVQQTASDRAKEYLSKNTQNSLATEFIQKTKYIDREEVESLCSNLSTINKNSTTVIKTKGATKYYEKNDILPSVFCISNPDCCDSDYIKDQFYSQETMDFLHLKDSEQQPIGSNYIKKLPELSSIVRRDIISWIAGIHLKMHLPINSLFLTVRMIDMYLKKNGTKLGELHALSISALFLAAKTEQRDSCYKLNQFITVCENVAEIEDVLKYEGQILQSINYSVSYVYPVDFIYRFSKIAALSMKEKLIAEMLIEISLLDIEMLDFKSSSIACAAIIAALWCTSKNSGKLVGNCEIELMKCKETLWTKTINTLTRCEWEDVSIPLHRFLLIIKKAKSVFKGMYIWEKYKTTQKLNVADIVLENSNE